MCFISHGEIVFFSLQRALLIPRGTVSLLKMFVET